MTLSAGVPIISSKLKAIRHPSMTTTMTMTASLEWPFGQLKCLVAQEIRDTAFELFVAACRSLPSFTARNKKTIQGNNGLFPSRVKMSLGLKASNKSPIVKKAINGKKAVRSTSPFTSPEIMRQQIGVTDGDNERLLHMLMKTLVGQVSPRQAGRRVETVILPLELIRNIMPSEFNNTKEYHTWQRKQLKILEVGLLLHPSIPLDKSNGFAVHLGDAVQASEAKAIHTGNNSDIMGSLINAVITLSWRSVDRTPSDTCHWAYCYPLNIHLYVALLKSIFDIKEDTVVLDEVDDLLELMKKTWFIVGINRLVHNMCLSWVFFQRYIVMNQTELDLLAAAQAVLEKVAKNTKKPDNDPVFTQVFSAASDSMRSWLEERLLNYHECFNKETVGMMENMLPLALTVLKASGENSPRPSQEEQQEKEETAVYVDLFIRSSLKNTFAKAAEDHVSGEALILMADEVEGLTENEAEIFSPVLGKWHLAAPGLALMTLHNLYGILLKQYLSDGTTLNEEVARVLKRAKSLEKNLVKIMINENTANGVEDGTGKANVVQDLDSYEIEAFITRLIHDWIDKKLEEVKSLLAQAKETETCNPKSKMEAFAQSSVELVELAEGAVDEFKNIHVGVAERLIHGLSNLFKDYISFVASCRSKQDYMPALPMLTRCHQDSKLLKLCRKASCGTNSHNIHESDKTEGEYWGPTMSRGTQRLYVRLNTLHYLLAHLRALHDSNNNGLEDAYSFIEEEYQHVSEVAAYPLIFRDSGHVLYDYLYSGNVSNMQFKMTLEVLKQNLSLLWETLNENARELATKYIMRASFDAYLRVLIAGGNSRVFNQSDHKVIEENFKSLRQEFSSLPEGSVTKEVVVVEGVIKLMGQSSEQLIEELSKAMNTTEAVDPGKKLPIPEVPERWSMSDPNTILRMLCHRNDRTATMFLNKSFQLEKRRFREGFYIRFGVLCF